MAIRAVQLFSTSTGTLAPSIQRAGALFTLSSLAQHELALTLASELISRKEIDSTTFAALTDAALRTDDHSLHRTALNALRVHAAALVDTGGFDFPRSLLNGCAGYSDYVRDWLPIVLAHVLLAKPRIEWLSQSRYSLNTLVSALVAAWQEEHVERIRQDTAAVLHAVIQGVGVGGGNLPSRIYTLAGVVEVEAVRETTANASPASDAGAEIVDRIRAWSGADRGPTSR